MFSYLQPPTQSFHCKSFERKLPNLEKKAGKRVRVKAIVLNSLFYGLPRTKSSRCAATEARLELFAISWPMWVEQSPTGMHFLIEFCCQPCEDNISVEIGCFGMDNILETCSLLGERYGTILCVS